MDDYNIKLLRELANIQSPTNDRAKAHRALDVALAAFDDTFTKEIFTSNDVRTALVCPWGKNSNRPKKFRVLFTAHLDTVTSESYKITERAGNMIGVGTLDMKAGAAVMINVFKDLAHQVDYPIGLQFTTDEESGGFNGAKYQVDQGVRADFVLSGEPTDLEIVHRTKNIIWCEVTVHGTAAHAAYPWRGDNAMWKLIDYLEKLKSEFDEIDIDPERAGKDGFGADGEAWQSTLNLAKISTTNEALNGIPDMAKASMDIRYVADDATKMMPRLKKHLTKDMELEILYDSPGVNVDPSNEILQNLASVVSEISGEKAVLRGANGTSDARFFAPTGAAAIEFGPVGGNIGAKNEYVELKSLDVYEQILREFLVKVNKK
ncbi:M20/M25/M40 family metallo-hydrolase [Candidatus Saccharibacteria bacterium]|nr:M20/M25/M40 family metallo-hydrolase [Candidatus Saccharibacteria bacterium]